MTLDGAMEQVVGVTCEPHARLRLEILRCRLYVRDYLHVDAGFIHLAQPQVVKVTQTPPKLGIVQDVMAAPQPAQVGRPEVLFECDPAHTPCLASAPPIICCMDAWLRPSDSWQPSKELHAR